MDHIMDWAKLIVPSVISIIGFVLTYYSMCKQFRNSIKQQLTEEQRKVYLDTYIDVEKISSRQRQNRRRRSMVSSLRSWHWTAASETKDSSREVSTMNVT